MILHKKSSKINKSILNQIKSHINDSSYIDQLMKNPEMTNIIEQILDKPERKMQEIIILKEYLKRLKKFLEILNFDNENISIDSLLTRVSREMQIEKLPKNEFLMRIGEKGDRFYFTLSGSVTILAPKEFLVYMTIDDYTKYLIILYNNNEHYLLKKTVRENEMTIPLLKEKYEIINPKLIIKYSSIEEYLNVINGKKLDIEEKEEEDSEEDLEKENKKEKKNKNLITRKFKLKIYGYTCIVDLGRGSTFGEVALINDNNQRTATVFVKTNSVFGTLTANAFKESMLVFLEKIKWEKIFFIFNTPIFKKLYINEIVKKYWNYFVEKKLKKGDFLFRKNENRENIYFILKGSVKLIIPQLTLKKTNIIISDIKNIYNSDLRESNEKKDIVISVKYSGEILGMDDCVINNIFFFNSICETSVFFYYINLKDMEKIMSEYHEIKNNYKKLNNNKINFILERLEDIKRVFLNSLEGKIFKNLYNEKIKNIENLFHENSITYKQEKKKLNKIIVGNLNITRNRTTRSNNLKQGNTYYRKKEKNYTTLPKLNLDFEKTEALIAKMKTFYGNDKNLIEEDNINSMKGNLYKLSKSHNCQLINNITEKGFQRFYLKRLLAKDDITKLLLENRLGKTEHINQSSNLNSNKTSFNQSNSNQINKKKNIIIKLTQNLDNQLPIKLYSYNSNNKFNEDFQTIE